MTYGHYGFPSHVSDGGGRLSEYERFYVIDAMQGSIEAGKAKVFSINSINRESWLNDELHPKYKALRQVQYNNYIAGEVVPYIWNSCQGRFGVITAGASLGAFHCANQLFRRPDLFAGCIAMSGAFDIRGYYKGDYYDDNVYFNNPVDYLPNIEGWTLEALRHKEHITSSPVRETTRTRCVARLSGILSMKGIPHARTLWGYRMPHDWPTWREIMKYYIQAKF